jgi:folate-binding protein YgfZ
MAEPAAAAAPQVYRLARDTLIVSGPDRKTWLDGLLTCAVGAVSNETGGYGLLLTKQGKIVTDAFMVDTGSELLLGLAKGRGGAVRELLDRYLVMEDAELAEPASPLVWCVRTSGAGAQNAAGQLARGSLVLGSLRAELEVTTQPAPDLPDAAELLAAHGLGVFGVDFGEHDNPHEASLDRLAVSWTKGCYLGQEVVCMQDMRGKVKRRLVALDGPAALLDAAELAAQAGELLAADGSVVGQVSSVHRTAGGARVLARISASALESHADLRWRGEPLRVAFGATSKVS